MPEDSFTHKYHEEPRLSASQISEYVYVNSTNRRRILRDAKFPPIGPMIQYEAARTALRNYLPATAANRDLSAAMSELSMRMEGERLSEFERKRAQLSWEALNGFYATEPSELRAMQLRRFGRRLPNLNLNGVAISANVDLRTRKIDRSGVIKTGGLVLFFCKRRDTHLDDHCKGLSLMAFEALKQDDESETLDATMCM